MELNEITGEIVDAAYQIHTAIGPGLLESVYVTMLARELELRGMAVEQERVISFEYKGMWYDAAFRADLLVEKVVVVEVKSVLKLAPVFEKQVLTYLRLLDLRVGLLLNFGAAYMKDGIRRIANGV